MSKLSNWTLGYRNVFVLCSIWASWTSRLNFQIIG